MGRKKTHGYSTDPIYPVWLNMMKRCSDPNKDHYERYGGRGITVCQEWKDVATFAEWAYANGYAKELQIDRINNDGMYCPENCRFVDRKQNLRNMSKNVFLDINGERKCLSEWAEYYGVNYKRAHHWYSRHGADYTIQCFINGVPDNRKQVYCEETDTVYDGIREAARELGCDYTHVSHCCHGDSKSHRGYHFHFV